MHSQGALKKNPLVRGYILHQVQSSIQSFHNPFASLPQVWFYLKVLSEDISQRIIQKCTLGAQEALKQSLLESDDMFYQKQKLAELSEKSFTFMRHVLFYCFY